MIGRVFRRVQRLEQVPVFGPEPVGEAGMDELNVRYGLQLAGHNGSVIWGEKSSPAMKYSGDLASPQAFIGAGSYGAKQGATPPGLAGVLPNTVTPDNVTGAMQSMFPAVP